MAEQEDLTSKSEKKSFNWFPILGTLAAVTLFGGYLYVADKDKARVSIEDLSLQNLPRITGDFVGQLNTILKGSQTVTTEAGEDAFSGTEKPRQLVIDRGDQTDLLFEVSSDGNYFRFKRLGGDENWNYFYQPKIIEKVDSLSSKKS